MRPPGTHQAPATAIGRAISLAGAILWLALAGPAAAALFSSEKLEVYGDFRLRLEADWDSIEAGGTPREDRNRARIRARLGLTYRLDERFSFGVRLRSGSDASHQSPHITVVDFQGNDTGDAHFNLDRWYLEASSGGLWGWVGRNDVPVWQQNEFLFDTDATPAGLALGWKTGVGERGTLTLQGGYFALPVGMRQFSGTLGAAQIVYARSAGETGFTAAAGHFAIEADPRDPESAIPLRGNGRRDYRILAAALQGRLRAGSRPLVLGLDLLHNAESYSADDPDPFTAANRDQTDGQVVSILYGGAGEPGDWLVGYYWARIETFAVNATYASDDWVRWGGGGEGRPSDMRGHELRFACRARPNLAIVARLFLVESITTREDGNRFRLDFNFSF